MKEFSFTIHANRIEVHGAQTIEGRGELDGDLVNAYNDFLMNREADTIESFLMGWLTKCGISTPNAELIARLAAGKAMRDKRHDRRSEEELYTLVEGILMNHQIQTGYAMTDYAAFKAAALQRLGESATPHELKSEAQRIKRAYYRIKADIDEENSGPESDTSA